MLHDGNSTAGVNPLTNVGPKQNAANGDDRMATCFVLVGVFIALVVIAICCSAPCIRRIFGRHSEPQPQEQAQPRRVGASDPEDLDKRVEFVKSNLPFRTFDVGDEETGNCPTSQRRSSKILQKLGNSARSLGSGIYEQAVRRSSILSQGSMSGKVPGCSICLHSYGKGDEVAWSTNPSCPHEFHRNCIQDWLQAHMDCPLCRNVFLPSDASGASDLATSDSTVTFTSEHGEEANHDQDLPNPSATQLPEP